MLRFSLAFLMLFVLVVALGCAALSYANEYWASAVLTVTLAALVVSVLAAVYRRGASRAFWVGFAVCGGCYLFLMYGPWFGELRGQLATTKLIAYAQSKLHPNVLTGGQLGGFWFSIPAVGLPAGGGQAYNSFINVGLSAQQAEHFIRIGHCLWALLLAGLGGLAARVLYATGAAKRHSEQGSPH